MKQLLERSRYVVLIGIAGSFVASFALFVFGLVSIAVSIWESVTASKPFSSDEIKLLSINLIQAIDVFLLATVLYIVALGLYELFIDEGVKLPEWLIVHTLDDLKARLLGVIIVILPVTFLGKLVEWKQGTDILWLSLSISVVLFAIAANQYAWLLKKPK